MANIIAWRRALHAVFGREFNRKIGALMLGVRRLEGVGVVPALDCAVLEETLESICLEPIPTEISFHSRYTIADSSSNKNMNGSIIDMMRIVSCAPITHVVVHIVMPASSKLSGFDGIHIGLGRQSCTSERQEWGVFPVDHDGHIYFVMSRHSKQLGDTALLQSTDELATLVDVSGMRDDDDAPEYFETDDARAYVFAVSTTANGAKIDVQMFA